MVYSVTTLPLTRWSLTTRSAFSAVIFTYVVFSPFASMTSTTGSYWQMLDLPPVPERYGLDNRVLEVDDFIGRHEEPERIRVRDFPRRIT